MTLKEFFVSAFSEPDGKSVSFARVATAALLLMFYAQDLWFFHRKGAFVDDSTFAVQMTFAASFYLGNKTQAGLTSIFGPQGPGANSKI